MSKLHIIYASTSGNTELVCEYLKSIFEQGGAHQIALNRAELTNFDLIAHNTQFIFATSTWEHGVLNPFFDRLYKDMQSADLSGKFAGFVGCGNSEYEKVHFCKGIDLLENVFTSHGGQKLGVTLKINGDPHEYLDTYIKKWAENFSLLF